MCVAVYGDDSRSREFWQYESHWDQNTVCPKWLNATPTSYDRFREGKKQNPKFVALD